jgi:formylmethanofuran dehydrogenase subunit E
MSPKPKPVYAGKMFDPSFCHHCNENKLDPKDKYYLPNGIEVCKQCAERHGSGTASRKARLRQVKKVKR